MKKTLTYLSFLFLAVACHKDNEPRPDILYINGLVTNKHFNTAIDSAGIILMHSSIGSFFHDTVLYSDINGKFNLTFSPQNDRAYTLVVDKAGFNSTFVSINIDKEFQNFNIALDTL